MFGLSFMRIAVFVTLIGLALAKSADCLVDEIKTLRDTVKDLNYAVLSFRHNEKPYARLRDIRPLLHINRLNIDVDSQLHELIEGLQTSCAFNGEDTQKILIALSEVQDPIFGTLVAFKGRHCEFEQAIGPVLTHRIVGGGLRQTRCLTMDLLRSFEEKAETDYKELISATQAEIDAHFQSVLRIY